MNTPRSYSVTFTTIYGRTHSAGFHGTARAFHSFSVQLGRALADAWGCSPMAIGVGVERVS